jgi:RimJ/RimL family protein N-acetyltransferase
MNAASVPDLHALWTAPGVRRYLWSDRVLPLEKTRDLVMQSEYLFDERDLGLWGAYAPEGAIIGFGGFWFFRNDHEIELLYGVDEAHWLRGYGREIAQTVMAYAFDQLALEEVRASTDAANQGSVRLLRKLGFMQDHERGRDPAVLFLRLPRGVYHGPA